MKLSLIKVIIRRYKCLSCGKTFRHYPPGITNKGQSRRADPGGLDVRIRFELLGGANRCIAPPEK